jgi:DNA-directed RNA polymerase sigma subunit (sigma70/sigma32)
MGIYFFRTFLEEPLLNNLLWIKQSIIQSLNDNARVIRLPTNVITKLSTLKKEIEANND